MKVRVIAGVRDPKLSDPLCGTWIDFVSFPMILTNYAYDGPEDDPKITINNEDELVEWANFAFEPEGYEIWDMEIPPAALGAPAPDLGRRLEAIDREITAVNDAGFFTSDMTDAIDDLWRHLDGRAVVNTTLLSEAADELEDAARRLADDARELEGFPQEAEAVEGHRAHAAALREQAAALRASAAPALDREVPAGTAPPIEDQEDAP